MSPICICQKIINNVIFLYIQNNIKCQNIINIGTTKRFQNILIYLIILYIDICLNNQKTINIYIYQNIIYIHICQNCQNIICILPIYICQKVLYFPIGKIYTFLKTILAALRIQNCLKIMILSTNKLKFNILTIQNKLFT